MKLCIEIKQCKVLFWNLNKPLTLFHSSCKQYEVKLTKMPYVPHRINSGILSMKYNQHWRGCHTSAKGATVEVFPAKGKQTNRENAENVQNFNQRVFSTKVRSILAKSKLILNRPASSILLPKAVNWLYLQLQFLLLPSKVGVRPNMKPSRSTHAYSLQGWQSLQ